LGVVHPALDNALFQWQDGERRLRASEPADQLHLERASGDVVEAIRRRLGSSFTLSELVELYAAGTDWAEDVAQRRARMDAVLVVDAAFARYAREASDYAGGRMYPYG
jgi:hypothetical protein